MNSVSYHSDEQVQAMLDRFDKVSYKNKTTVITHSTSIEFRCECGCMKVEHFAVSCKVPYKHYYVELCSQHSIKLD